MKAFLSIFLLSFFPIDAWADRQEDSFYKGEVSRISKLDPSKAVNKEILSGEFNVFIYRDRGGMHVPGFTVDQEQKLNPSCGKVVMKYVGDVIYSSAHLEYHVAYHDYAEAYNKHLLQYCFSEAVTPKNGSTIESSG